MDANDDPETMTVEEQHKAAGIDPETGFGMVGGYPANYRMRAEALHAEGIATDPSGMVSDDLIAATGERVTAEAKAKAEETPSADWTKADLVEHAADAGITVPSSATKADVLDLLNPAPGNTPTAPTVAGA